MVGLLDIAPIKASVDVNGTKIELSGLDASSIFNILYRFPVLREAIAKRTFNPEDLFHYGGGVVDAIIAAGVGFVGDEEQEKAVSNISLDKQVECIIQIFKLTFPNGIGPLVEQLEMLGVEFEDQSTKGQNTKSQKQSKNS